MRRLAPFLLVLAACGGGTSAGDDAGADADPGPDADVLPTGDPDYVFDLSKLLTFDIEMAPADWEWLEANALLEEYRPAELVFEGHRWTNVAVRFKGSYGSLESCFEDGVLVCPKLSMKIKFNEYNPDGRFYDLRKLVFNSAVRDDTMLHEVLTYYLYRSMGVPAPRASHALINVNGEPQGLYVMVEAVDKEFIQDRWGAADQGNLYKQVWPQYPDALPYQDALETNETVGDVSRMLTLHDTVAASSDATFVADVDGQLDLAGLARYLAVDRVVSNDDGIKEFYCYVDGATPDQCYNANYYWYELPGGPDQLIPWDEDYTLGDINTDLGRSYWDPSPNGCAPIPFCDYWQIDPCPLDAQSVWLLPPQCNTLYGLIHRATWNDYRGALSDLITGPMAPASIVPMVTALRDKLRPAVAADTHGPGILTWENANDWLDEVLSQSITEVETLLAEPPM